MKMSMAVQLMINAKYETINIPVKVDITTGDIITPEAVRYTFHSSFEEKKGSKSGV